MFAERVDGRMRVDLDEVRFGASIDIHAKRLRFDDPRGRPVAEARGVRAHLPLGELLGGTLAIRRAQVDEATVFVRPGERASTSLEETFSSGGDSSSSALAVAADVEVGDARLVVAMPAAPRLVLDGLDGALEVRRPAGEPADVRLRGFDGRLLVPDALGMQPRVLGADATIRAERDPVLRLQARVCVAGDPLDARLIYGPARGARLATDGEGLVARLTDAGLGLVGELAERLETPDTDVVVRAPPCPADSG
ncbi:MAG TPA: hypothetical protein RMH85_22180 [Polyangiaceae bacterium LLY-WYZ-15_(1-7)]|nr:hypothetical protein [Myxococcales bacterium]MAT25950.1 hypothetical protein [Sandaracinus sp.]HJL03265.1 hypothetical protein [Polyangiaceae bacterium LLY-WYZ-15_(1-7)]HJL11201.1 hypothetical protein [Polyangiaceae bacterium LLY-WYZ-15_(1-7)]HJL27415.1 hypothetical protein [Polyangiaceae bacterium LLY-WYZ-15_(1-7)]